MSEGEFRRHFWSSKKLPTQLLYATAVAQLKKPLVDKSGTKLKLPKPNEVCWTNGKPNSPSGV